MTASQQALQLEAGRKRRVWRLMTLAAALALALLLRLWGITSGFPYIYHYDEPTYVRIALDLRRGVVGEQANPTGFANILQAGYAAWFGLDGLASLSGLVGVSPRSWPVHPTFELVMLGRLTSAALGALTVAITYQLGKIMSGWVVGLLASTIVAVSFLHARGSHHCVPDIAVVFWVSATVLLSAMAVHRHKSMLACLAAVTAGMAVATKWTAAPVALPVLLAAAQVNWPRVDRRNWPLSVLVGLVALGLAFLAGFLVGAFEVLLEPRRYLDYLRLELRAGAGGGFWIWQVDTVSGWIFYLKTLAYGLGLLPLVAALAGLVHRIVVGLRSRDTSTLLLFSFLLPYYLAMGSTRHYFARYALPLFPFLALFAGEALCAVVGWVSARLRLGRWWLATSLTLLIIAQPLASSVRHGVLLARTDTRTIAKEWIEDNMPPGSKFALDWPVYSPPLSRELYVVREQGGLGLAKRSLDWYQQESFDYVVTSNYVYGLRLVDSDQAGMRAAFYASLDDELELVAEVSPYATANPPSITFEEIYGPATHLWQRQRPGPLLRVYRVR